MMWNHFVPWVDLMACNWRKDDRKKEKIITSKVTNILDQCTMSGCCITDWQKWYQELTRWIFQQQMIWCLFLAQYTKLFLYHQYLFVLHPLLFFELRQKRNTSKNHTFLWCVNQFVCDNKKINDQSRCIKIKFLPSGFKANSSLVRRT